MSLVNSGRRVARALGLPPVTKAGKFLRSFNENLAACDWSPHPDYSVFTQNDGSFYRGRREEFLRKYRCFWAVSKTIGAERMVELGVHAGSGADAYLSGNPGVSYVGVEYWTAPWWDGVKHEETGAPWRPREVLERLFAARGYEGYRLIDADLRALKELPAADFVVVDAAHDEFNEYEDMKLALTARPTWMFVDDTDEEAAPAIQRFLAENEERVEFTCRIEYVGGGLVIRLRA